MSSKKVAIVTGSNKGIGFAIVKGLCEKFDGDVILTSRNVQRGQEAIGKLQKLGFQPKFHQLDVLDSNSISALAQFIKQQYGGIDILVNNAAIAFNRDATEPVGIQAEETIKSNFTALLNVCNALFPLLRANAQIVNVSSCCGHLSKIPSDALKNKLKDPALTVEDLKGLMEQFVRSAKAGTNAEDGWGKSAYNVSKVGVSALTIIQQKHFDDAGKNVFVNSVHPGYVDTDMTNHSGPLSIEEGAVGPLFLALENHGLKGKYVWKDCTVWDWTANDTPAPY